MKMVEFFQEIISPAGLEINDEMIRVVALKKTAMGYKLEKLAVISTPSKSVLKGRITSIDKVAKALKELWKKNKIWRKQVFLSISTPETFLRVITLPYQSLEKIVPELSRRVNQYLAFAGTNPLVSFEILSDFVEEGERKAKVLLAAIPRKVIDAYLQAIEKADLIPSEITFFPLAILRAFADGSLKSKPQELKTLIALNHSQTFIVVLQGGKIDFIHRLERGRQDFISAESTKEELVESLKKTIVFYQQQSRETGKFIFSLSSPALKDLPNFISKKLEIPIENGWGTLEKGKALKEKEEDLFLSMAAVGAARLEPFKITLLPSEVKLKQTLRAEMMLFLASLTGISFLTLLSFLLLYFGNLIFHHQISLVGKELTQPSLVFTQLREIEDKTKEIRQLILRRQDLTQRLDPFRWNDLLREISHLILPSIRLTRLEVRPDNLVALEGEASSSDAIFDFVQRLKKARNLDQVNLQVVRQKEEEEVEALEERGIFSFTILAERKI